MLLDEKGKLFGKVSIIDLLIVLAVVVCLIGVYVRFGSFTGKAVSQDVKIVYTYKVSGVRQVGVDALNKKGDLYDSKTQEFMGKITNVTVSPSHDYGVRADGRIVDVAMPERFDVLLTVELNGKESKTALMTEKSTPLESGSRIFLVNKWATTEGTIIDAKITEISDSK